jgi:hypothetical protein
MQNGVDQIKNTLYVVCTTKSPNVAFLKTYPRR